MAQKIIYIEDEEFFASITKKKLEEKGFEVDVVADGQKGLEAVQNGDYQLVLLDLILPNLDGLEVLRILKEGAETKHIPIIVLSNQSEEDNKKRAVELGADDYLVKVNVMPNEIANAVAKFLSGA